MNDLWNARRVALEQAARTAVLNLFEHTQSSALKLPLDPPHETLHLYAGDAKACCSLIATNAGDAK